MLEQTLRRFELRAFWDKMRSFCTILSGWIFEKVIDSYKPSVPNTPPPLFPPKLSSPKLL